MTACELEDSGLPVKRVELNFPATEIRDVNSLEVYEVHNLAVVVANMHHFTDVIPSIEISLVTGLGLRDEGLHTIIVRAAMLYKDVLVAVDPEDYAGIVERLESDEDNVSFRKKLSQKARDYLDAYDAKLQTGLTDSCEPKVVFAHDAEKLPTG